MRLHGHDGSMFCEHGTAITPICGDCRVLLKGPSGPTPLESEIEAECTKLLEEDGWRPLRTDPVSDKGRGKGFGELGMADHLYVRYEFDPLHGPGDNCRGQILWIEFKRPGKKPKKHQIEWHTKERARGALTLIAGEDFPATVKGFTEWYADSGLRGISRR
jgi:hypothetical protein